MLLCAVSFSFCLFVFVVGCAKADARDEQARLHQEVQAATNRASVCETTMATTPHLTVQWVQERQGVRVYVGVFRTHIVRSMHRAFASGNGTRVMGKHPRPPGSGFGSSHAQLL